MKRYGSGLGFIADARGPAGLLLGTVVQLTDFNLSRILDDSMRSSSLAAMNPRWLAPELLNGGHASKACDIFGFGVVLWEMMEWSVPWGSANPWSVSLRAARVALQVASFRSHGVVHTQRSSE